MASDGKVVVEKVGEKSSVTRCFSKYPLKFIIPRKVYQLTFSFYSNSTMSYIVVLLLCVANWFSSQIILTEAVGMFLLPFSQVGPSKTDAVWIYSLTYGGGVVSVCHYIFISYPFHLYFIVLYIYISFDRSNYACQVVIVSEFVSYWVGCREILFHVSLPLEMLAPLSLKPKLQQRLIFFFFFGFSQIDL